MDKKYLKRTNIAGWPSPSEPHYDWETWNRRVDIVKLYFPHFNPTNHIPDEGTPYTQEWWNSLTRDQQSAAFWTALAPERCKKDWKPSDTSEHVEFYDPVSLDNAYDWYMSCPPHLRKTIDAELETLPDAESASTSDPVYQEVKCTWGDRPKMRPEYGEEDVYSCVWLQEWCHEYEKRKLESLVVKVAPRMQRERKLLSQALGLKQGGNGLPSQAEGLDDTQAATVRWLQTSGETPLEYLTSVYRTDDDSVRVSDKIAAARALLDYVHRKVPQQVEVKGPTQEETNTSAAIVRDIGEQLARLAALNKKSEK